MAEERNPYRPGTEKYARFRKAILTRKANLARANAVRAKSPEARRRMKRRLAATNRELRAIEERESFRSKLNEEDRAGFARWSISEQRRLLAVRHVYPESVPKEDPDPMIGPKRDQLWRLYYSTRTGIRLGKKV